VTQKEIDKMLAAKRKLLAILEKKYVAAEKAVKKGNDLVYELDEQLGNLDSEIEDLEVEEPDEDQVATGEIPSPEQAQRMKAQVHSYGVTFVRSKPRKGVLVLHSERRFSSLKEAHHHGKRFTKKHNHAEYSVCIVQKKANAWVNWKTGKTNPVI